MLFPLYSSEIREIPVDEFTVVNYIYNDPIMNGPQSRYTSKIYVYLISTHAYKYIVNWNQLVQMR